MERKRISSGSPFEAKLAYTRAVVAGDWCFVSGTTGYDYARMVMPGDAGEQAANALGTIARVLEEAGFALSDVVRVSYYVTDAALMEEIAPVLRAAFGDHPPAATMLVCGLVAPEMKVEIEVTACRG